MEDSTSSARRTPVLTREVYVWIYVTALAVVGALGWALFTHDGTPMPSRTCRGGRSRSGSPSPEICVVHVSFRRSAHSFSLADVPFVFGLVFATGDDFVLGALIGTGIVWGLIRRLEVVKLCFNLAQLAIATSVAAGVLHLVAGDADALQPATWIGLYAASLASGALTIVLLGGAIALAEGNLKPPMLVQMFATDALVTLINASIAIAAALVVATDPRAVPVLLVPAPDRLRRSTAPTSPSASATSGSSSSTTPTARSPARRRWPRPSRRCSPGSLEAFNADVAEVLLFTGDGDPLRTTHGPGDLRVSMEPADRARRRGAAPASSTPRTRSSRSPRPSAPRTCARTCSSAASATR